MFIAQPFVVSGSSMIPTFEDGEYLIVDEISYRFSDPMRGEVIIFQYPKDTSKFFIKRIIGLPFETVEIRDGNIVVTNTAHPDGIVVAEPYLTEFSHESFSITLGADEFFVLGDNRPASSDSRVWGPLHRDFIIGKALVRLLPLERAMLNPGQEHELE